MTKDDQTGFLTVSEIADRLKVSHQTIYRWCRAGRLPFYDLDSTYRFDEREFADWLQARHRRPVAPQEDEQDDEAGSQTA